MELTAEELEEVIKSVIKSIGEEGEKGRDGYVDDEVKPNGYCKTPASDFSEPSEEGNITKKQGSSNMGPWTSESVLRAFISKIIRESIKVKHIPQKQAKLSAPYNAARIQVGEAGDIMNSTVPAWHSTKKGGTVWEDIDAWYRPKTQHKTRSQAKFEGNMLDSVYEARTCEKKDCCSDDEDIKSERRVQIYKESLSNLMDDSSGNVTFRLTSNEARTDSNGNVLVRLDSEDVKLLKNLLMKK